MKNWMFLIGMALLLTGGCQQDDALISMEDLDMKTQEMRYTAQVGEQITLQVGDVVNIMPDGFSVRFRDIPEDNRCPAALDCIWEGRAVIELGIEKKGNVEVILLETPNSQNENGNLGNVQGRTIKLLKVAPYPQTDNFIPLRQYKIVIQVLPQVSVGDSK